MNSQQRRQHRRRWRYRVKATTEIWAQYPWDADDWCLENFGKNRFRMMREHGLVTFCFDEERNAVMFALRWSGDA